ATASASALSGGYARRVHLNLAYRWFCGLGLDGEVPDHSTFSKNRHGRFRDSDLLRRLFETVLQRCIEEGLVGGEGFAIDASLIAAEASDRTRVEGTADGALTGALAALDIALWDVKGKFLGQPIYKLLGGAWRTSLPFYASIGGNGARNVDEVLRIVEARLKDNPAGVKIRFDNDRTRLDLDLSGDIAKAKAVRKLVGDGFPLAFDANNGYSTGGAIRVGRALEELGYWWFEEPVQHYHVRAMG